MHARRQPISEVDDAAKAAWAAIQEANPHLASPFFRPEFAECCGEVRGGVEVAVLEAGETTGYLPYHRDRGRVARGPAAHLSDVEGAAITPDARFEPMAFVRQCDLRAWRFHHLVGSHPGVEPVVMARAENPFIDLSAGYEAYRDDRMAKRSRLYKEIGRKARKAERQRTVEFTFDDRDPEALTWLAGQKAVQLKCIGAWNYFRVPWTVPLMRACVARRGEAFRGLVSTLRHDGRIVAAHIGLQSGPTLHAWTHTYDPRESSLSVGMVMLCRLSEEAAAAGITRIDLGRGDESYKSRFASGSLPLSEGAAEIGLMPRLARKAFYAGREAVRHTPIGPSAQKMIRTVRDWKRGLLPREAGRPLSLETPATQ